MIAAWSKLKTKKKNNANRANNSSTIVTLQSVLTQKQRACFF